MDIDLFKSLLNAISNCWLVELGIRVGIYTAGVDLSIRTEKQKSPALMPGFVTVGFELSAPRAHAALGIG
jgi:hypothetical protein